MRLCVMALVSLGLIVCATDSMADDNSDSNSANDPTTPKFSLQYWNYYAPSLNNQNGGAENGTGRMLIPFNIDGVQQIMHIDPPVVTNPNAKTGPRTGPRRHATL